jgi:hypothetical protein
MKEILKSLKAAAFKKKRDEHHGHGARRQTDVHKMRKHYDRQRDKKGPEKNFRDFSFTLKQTFPI